MRSLRKTKSVPSSGTFNYCKGRRERDRTVKEGEGWGVGGRGGRGGEGSGEQIQ